MDSNWYMDSSATNHITTNLNNLTIKENYRGKEKLTIGNGQNLNIKQVGSTSFNLHTNSQPLNLKNILHVLSITKNLLNISHFTNDNNVIFEFYVDCFYVKNKNSRKVLLHGTLRNGLYQLNVSSLHLRLKSSLTSQNVVLPSVYLTEANDSSVSTTLDTPTSMITNNCFATNLKPCILEPKVNTTAAFWHHRLGHRSKFVLDLVLKN